MFEHNSFVAAFAISGHRAGLYDAADLDLLVNGKKYQVKDRLADILNRASEKITLLKFKKICLDSDTPVLCILNLRRQAYELLVAVRRNLEERKIKDLDESVFHLSSAMCPAHRLDRIELIKNDLKLHLQHM